MKTMKRLLAGSVALLVMLSVLLTSAFAAADAYTANYPDPDPTYRSYKAYQIFKGVTGGGTIGNVAWGDGINGDAFLLALKGSTAFVPNPFLAATTANDVAVAMTDTGSTTNWVDDGPYAHAFAKLAYQYKKGTGVDVTDGVTTLDKGYYLVVDSHTPNPNQGESFNLALLQLTDKGTFRIVSKASGPVVEKKVKEKEDVGGTVTGWQDAADYDAGDDVPFQLTATIGDITQYNKYYVQFNDTLNNAFTYNDGSATVTRVRGTSTYDVTSFFDVLYVGTSPKTLTISPKSTANYDVKNAAIGVIKGDKLVVEYTAKFQPTLPNAGQTGYENKVNLTYTNNPNVSSYGNGTKPTPSETDNTPDDEVKVFTYAFEINKVDELNNPLTGADFKLEKFDVGYTDPTTSSHWKEIATITPVIVGTTTKFEWDGLDAGLYRFTETTTPGGYNGYNLGGTDRTPQPMEFTITHTFDESTQPPQLTGLTGTLNDGPGSTPNTALTVTLTAAKALLSTNIQNLLGNTLPETGGAGTTMFYVAGSALLLGGIVLLITKRRMGR